MATDKVKWRKQGLPNGEECKAEQYYYRMWRRYVCEEGLRVAVETEQLSQRLSGKMFNAELFEEIQEEVVFIMQRVLLLENICVDMEIDTEVETEGSRSVWWNIMWLKKQAESLGGGVAFAMDGLVYSPEVEFPGRSVWEEQDCR